jgi:transposase-like protein
MIAIHTEKQRKYYYEVIRMHFEESMGIDRIAREVPVGHTTISRWINAYSGPRRPTESSNSLRMFDYAMELRASGMPITHICKKLDVSRSTLYRWMIIFAEDKGKRPIIMQKTDTNQPIPQDAQARITELEGKLRNAELARDAYDEMISEAESKFNIPIRKKAGAKR